VEPLAVGHLFPDYLNIYADRGNIAVLSARAEWRGYRLEVQPLGAGAEISHGEHDLFYIGGGQDREQALIAPELASLGPALCEAFEAGAAFLAVCGGYQLLGRYYRDQSGEELPGIGLLPLHTVAGSRRMIGDVLLECELEPGARRTLAGFENHAGQTILDPGAEPLGRVVSGFGNDGKSGYEGCRRGRAIGTAPYRRSPRFRAPARRARAGGSRSLRPPSRNPRRPQLAEFRRRSRPVLLRRTRT